jgi:nicotine oxidoreductase
MKFKLKKAKVVATLPFIKKDAIRQMNIAYYKAQSKNIKQYEHIENEKKRRSTKKWDFVTGILNKFKEAGYTGPRSTAGKTLQGIYQKNVAYAKNSLPFRKTTNIMNLVAKPEMLLLAYKRLKRNKGAMTRASDVDASTFMSYTEKQKEIFFKKKFLPDGFSLRDIYLTSELLKKGKYPWGASRRIWLDKPGDKTKKRPITIPPFLDKVVQESIKMILVAIWEPDFEKMNRSFGFRPNKSCHDAIIALYSNETLGLSTVIEGDIQGAYDNVKKETIIKLLEKKIKDNKFIKFMKERLNYEYVDEENKIRVRPEMGIPQGGIDSPYLFNIYLLELDKYVHYDLKEDLDNLNEEMKLAKGRVGVPYKPRRAVDSRLRRRKEWIEKIKQKPIPLKDKNEFKKVRGEIKKLQHKLNLMPYYDKNKRRLRLFYVRYADDWILLTNGNKQIATKIKEKIKTFLQTELGATLSEKKTLITDIKKETAHFLGFEIRRYAKPRLMKTEKGIQRVSTFPLKFSPDKQRLINKLHTKGFCDKKGFPISVPWLSTLEANVIIERFNASIRGLMQYYSEWITSSGEMSRWVYILRYSCLKTLAQKYRSSISKIFKRFGTDMYSKSTKTIAVKTSIKLTDSMYQREWKLDTYTNVKDVCKEQKRWLKLNQVFNEREKGEIGNYPIKPERPTVTHENFVDQITWVSLRTQASLSMPCAVCGSMEDVEMHHIKHIRKTAYSLLKEQNFLRVMSLRNRKQIPVCQSCHWHIHRGDYKGPPLRTLINLDNKLVDNRVLHVESYVKPGKEYHSKSLEERGRKPIEKEN